MNITQRDHAQMLTDDVAQRLARYHRRHCFIGARCLLTEDDHGPCSIEPIIPYAPFERARIFTGTRESGSFNHHAQVARFKEKYFFGFSNGRRDELSEGQRLMVASSEDGRQWSEPLCVAGGRDQKSVAHTCVGLHADADMLYMFGRQDEAFTDPDAVGMRRVTPQKTKIHIYASPDGESWNKVSALDDLIRCTFEAPRETADGHLLCVSTLQDGIAMLRWPGNQLTEQPEIIPVPDPDGARFPSGEGSWYQLDNGRIIVFWRDEGESCNLWVNVSDDGGKTFSAPIISDIPDSMSRVYAGRLQDGRYYLCNNAFPTLLNRMHLMLLLSDDGETFNQVYTLVDAPTTMRVMGLLKTDGYQYPCCLADGDKLLVGYSVNKEDMECGVVNLKAL